MRPRRVIAIAREITLPALDPAFDKPEFYLPMGTTSRTLYLNLRCWEACPPAEMMQQRIRRLHPALGATVVQPGEQPFAMQLELPSAIAQVSATFGIVAVLTASCGLYSVLTFIARRRRREFGIRQMLGASPRHVRQLVLRQGALVVACGTLIGVIGGWIVSRSLSAFLYGVVLLDPLTWTAPLALLAAASVGAMWLPCRTAAYANPVMLVREE
jgi:ABC-type antimicrobial peptide transport system permease subunit